VGSVLVFNSKKFNTSGLSYISSKEKNKTTSTTRTPKHSNEKPAIEKKQRVETTADYFRK
jgi:hypothetical protein